MKLLFAALLTLAIPAVAQQAITWRFDNLTKIGETQITTVGSPRVVNTSIGKAIHFEGRGNTSNNSQAGNPTGDALFLNAAPLSGDATYTFEVIFRPSSKGAPAQRFFHMQDSNSQSRRMFEIRIVNNKWCLDTVGIDIHNGPEQHGVTLVCDAAHLHPLDRWYAIAATYDGKTLRGYVDGELQGEIAVTLAPLPPGTTSVGTRIDKRDFFTGDIYSARFTPRVLPTADFLNVPDASVQQPVNNKPALTRENVTTLLGFEGPASPNGLPSGWSSAQASQTSLDSTIVHTGKQSVRIERTASSLNQFTSIAVSIPADFAGHIIQLSGYFRVEDVKGNAALWLREDDRDGNVVSFANGEGANFGGTSDWKQFTLAIPAKQDATKLFAGALLIGTGKAWVDDLELLVDGKPIAEAPSREMQLTALDRDREFAGGSRIHIDTLSNVQVENLATFAEIWGFLKYHHPAVTSGERNWDFDLFRVMPSILAAHNRDERNVVLLKWIDSLGSIKPCSPCATNDKDPQLASDIAWIHDNARFGAALSERLQSVYINRPDNQQFYLDLAPGVGNAVFRHEPGYRNLAFPDSGYQLLTLFRWWNDLEWWYPDRDLIPNLHKVLRDYVRPVATAKDKTEFTLTTMKLIGEARDTHANLWSSINLRPPTGGCRVAAALRFVQGQFVVWSVLGEGSNLQRGDAIESIDGHSAHDIVAAAAPFYADSNDAARHRDLARQLTNGSCGPVTLGIRRTGTAMQVVSSRVSSREVHEPFAHDLAGETFRLLSPDVAYLKISSARSEDVSSYMQRAQGTKGLIIDIRNYPSGPLAYVLGQALVQKPTPFARLPYPELSDPGTFSRGNIISLQSLNEVHSGRLDIHVTDAHIYSGRVVIIVDEISQSAAEFAAMAFRVAPNAVVVGSQTAGADGNVSSVTLPFGLSALFSGLGVRTPTGGQTQQVGIARDVEATPTIAGIAAGRDEVLETAIRQIIGDNVPQSDLEHMAHR